MSALRPGDLTGDDLELEPPMVDHDRGGRFVVWHSTVTEKWWWHRVSNGRRVASGQNRNTQRDAIRTLELTTGGTFLASMRGPRGVVLAGYVETRGPAGVLATRVPVDFVTVDR